MLYNLHEQTDIYIYIYIPQDLHLPWQNKLNLAQLHFLIVKVY